MDQDLEIMLKNAMSCFEKGWGTKEVAFKFKKNEETISLWKAAIDTYHMLMNGVLYPEDIPKTQEHKRKIDTISLRAKDSIINVKNHELEALAEEHSVSVRTIKRWKAALKEESRRKPCSKEDVLAFCENYKGLSTEEICQKYKISERQAAKMRLLLYLI